MRRVPIALATAAGGLLVMLGAALPWLTMFAGLQQYRGLIGLNGKLLFAGGAIALIAGGAVAQYRGPALAWSVAALGSLMSGFAAWLLAGVRGMVAHGLGAMLVPRVGPGLLVVLAGSLLLMAVPLFARAPRPSGSAGTRGDLRRPVDLDR